MRARNVHEHFTCFLHLCTRFSIKVHSKLADKSGEATNRMLVKTMQQAKRFARIFFGFLLIALGIVMVVTPGPGWLFVVLGLGVLAAEFAWARQLLTRLKDQAQRVRNIVVQRVDRA
jgi:uncharacterized protein (TIGR02611 family)